MRSFGFLIRIPGEDEEDSFLCIDTGRIPVIQWGAEGQPNGDRINMGAYVWDRTSE